MVDASDIGDGVVLMQSDDKDIHHSFLFLVSHQKNYSTIKNRSEAIALATSCSSQF